MTRITLDIPDGPRHNATLRRVLSALLEIGGPADVLLNDLPERVGLPEPDSSPETELAFASAVNASLDRIEPKLEHLQALADQLAGRSAGGRARPGPPRSAASITKQRRTLARQRAAKKGK